MPIRYADNLRSPSSQVCLAVGRRLSSSPGLNLAVTVLAIVTALGVFTPQHSRFCDHAENYLPAHAHGIARHYGQERRQCLSIGERIRASTCGSGQYREQRERS
jgi:hypothetical protein